MVETIFLVRHGEAESNLEKYFAGWHNSPLTALGRQQALVLKKRLAKEGIEQVFCSDLRRARETAEGIGLSCPTEFTPALREKNYGDLEGVDWGKEEEKYQKYHLDSHLRAPNGENYEDVEKRVMDYSNRKIFGAKEEKVLVVSHHGPIVIFACHMLGIPLPNWRRLRLGNCGLCIFTKENGMWRMKLWNSLSHFGLDSFTPLLSGKNKASRR